MKDCFSKYTPARYFGIILVLSIVCIPSAFAAQGVAEIKGTAADSMISGKATLTDTPDGLKVQVDLANVPPGKHGFHIHENGSCAEEGKAAGGHFNPDGVAHGFVPMGFEHAHAGDFGNIHIDEDGTGHAEAIVKGLSLSGGKYNVSGRAMILHEKEDDFGQPTGNAGGRIGCGVIQ